MENNEIKLVPQVFHTVARSFSRKVQVKQFEPFEAFSSHSESIPLEEATQIKIQETSNRLYELAKNDCEKDIANYLREAALANGQAVLPNAAEIVQIAHFIKDLAEGGKENVDSVAQKIALQKDTLTETQLTFLRQLALHLKNV